jgi:hypothetical protein
MASTRKIHDDVFGLKKKFTFQRSASGKLTAASATLEIAQKVQKIADETEQRVDAEANANLDAINKMIGRYDLTDPNVAAQVVNILSQRLAKAVADKAEAVRRMEALSGTVVEFSLALPAAGIEIVSKAKASDMNAAKSEKEQAKYSDIVTALESLNLDPSKSTNQLMVLPRVIALDEYADTTKKLTITAWRLVKKNEASINEAIRKGTKYQLNVQKGKAAKFTTNAVLSAMALTDYVDIVQ